VKVRFEVTIPETGDLAPADGMPTPDEVARVLDNLFRFEDSVPWYGEVRRIVGGPA